MNAMNQTELTHMQELVKLLEQARAMMEDHHWDRIELGYGRSGLSVDEAMEEIITRATEKAEAGQ